MFRVTKKFEGFSCTFRQWRAEGTFCKFIHGYGVSFEVFFKGELDEKNWVWDFGGMKRAKGKIDGKSPADWMSWYFDHTTLVADDDPEIKHFAEMANRGLLRLRTMPAVGAERFAEFIYHKLNAFVKEETAGRVQVDRVIFRENDKNSATYYES